MDTESVVVTNTAQPTSDTSSIESALRAKFEKLDAGEIPSESKVDNALEKSKASKTDDQGDRVPDVEQEGDNAVEEGQEPEEPKKESTDEPEKPQEDNPEDDPKAAYNNKRLAENFKKLEKERKEFNAEAKRLNKEKQQWHGDVDRIVNENKALKERVSVYETERPDVIKLDPEFFKTQAKEARQRGDYDEEEKWLNKADNLQKELTAHYNRQAQTKEEWNRQVSNYKKQIADDYPDVLDTNSELRKTAEAIFQGPDYHLVNFLKSVPQGELYAVQLAQMQIDANRATVLDKKVVELEKQIKDANKKLGLSGSSKPMDKGVKPLSKMSREEAEQHVRAKFMALDNNY